MAQINYISRVAIVGASGHLGRYFVEELTETGKHTVTALTRDDSKSIIPQGVKVVRVDYEDEQSLVSALEGQQFLVITLSVFAPHDTHRKLVNAAAKANIKSIMPNVYGYDKDNTQCGVECLYGSIVTQNCKDVADAGLSYIAMTSGFWYECSLALGESWYGFDLKNKRVTFFDNGGSEKDWTITYEQCKERYESAIADMVRAKTSAEEQVTKQKIDKAELQSADVGYKRARDEMEVRGSNPLARAMYTRAFYPTGDTNFDSARLASDKLLRLPEESLDEATKRAIDMVESGWNPFAY